MVRHCILLTMCSFSCSWAKSTNLPAKQTLAVYAFEVGSASAGQPSSKAFIVGVHCRIGIFRTVFGADGHYVTRLLQQRNLRAFW